MARIRTRRRRCIGGRRALPGASNCTGKSFRYNNLVDLDAAWQLVCELTGPAAAIIKHTNPCGLRGAGRLVEAYRKALEATRCRRLAG